jgi:GT2 family glycosyltransferase
MINATVTIAVVPRERFSHTAATLESIYEHTPQPFELVWVDGGSPARVARYLRKQASARGFKLLRTDRYLSPNEARNLAIEGVTTEYLVFVDNDVLVTPGWLDWLVSCADETRAWIVGPLTLIGQDGTDLIHHAGGELGIQETEVGGRLTTERHFPDKRLRDVGPLERRRTATTEFHCVLVRSELFRQVGKLDELLLSMFEEIDLCLAASEAGGDIYFEPRAVVSYVPVPPFALSDLPYYLLRWSEDWNETSLRRFQEKWGLIADDPYSCGARAWATEYRQSPLWQLRPLVDRFTDGRSYWIERRLLAPLEAKIGSCVARWADRNAGDRRVSAADARSRKKDFFPPARPRVDSAF